ncbi:hypothetical protein MHH33_17220 [Paenisporosarcina sp. FSL H8-0542]|uniref:hypothetical protein n=1 Tax=unclassified Paenisporosarcina TaxID=2642018 RepID=UPI00034E0C97|nr:hypothetical protein [Paenisporosarcina sp. HGH0030]EPD51053.1 hypothetical protein HMPREF1210_02244 [Paenisporosarcina sp. HGH0030]
MKMRKEVTPKFLIIMCVAYSLFVISQCLQVMYTPSTVLKVVNLIAIVFLSGVIGAFIREIFILKKKRLLEEMNNDESPQLGGK